VISRTRSERCLIIVVSLFAALAAGSEGHEGWDRVVARAHWAKTGDAVVCSGARHSLMGRWPAVVSGGLDRRKHVFLRICVDDRWPGRNTRSEENRLCRLNTLSVISEAGLMMIGVRILSGTNELYIAILDALYAGAAYVLVDADGLRRAGTPGV
jgi:hypothetical protein